MTPKAWPKRKKIKKSWDVLEKPVCSISINDHSKFLRKSMKIIWRNKPKCLDLILASLHLRINIRILRLRGCCSGKWRKLYIAISYTRIWMAIINLRFFTINNIQQGIHLKNYLQVLSYVSINLRIKKTSWPRTKPSMYRKISVRNRKNWWKTSKIYISHSQSLSMKRMRNK